MTTNQIDPVELKKMLEGFDIVMDLLRRRSTIRRDDVMNVSSPAEATTLLRKWRKEDEDSISFAKLAGNEDGPAPSPWLLSEVLTPMMYVGLVRVLEMENLPGDVTIDMIKWNAKYKHERVMTCTHPTDIIMLFMDDVLQLVDIDHARGFIQTVEDLFPRGYL